MDLCDCYFDTPLCAAATHCHLPILRFLVKQYQARGKSELERAMSHPCAGEERKSSLLGHVVERSHSYVANPAARVAMARYLVQECGQDPLVAICSSLADGEMPVVLLPIHDAALMGDHAMVRYFIDECGIPVDTTTTPEQSTPLHLACIGTSVENVTLPLIHYLVDKGASLTFRNRDGTTAAEIALSEGHHRIHEFLAEKHKEMAKRAAAASAASQLAEQTRATEAAAQALMEELTAEEAAEEEAKKQTKKNKKGKAKSKQVRSTAGGRDERESKKGGGGFAAAAVAAVTTTSAGLSVAAVTMATSRLSMGEIKEEKAQEKKEEGGQADDALSAPAAPMATPPPPSAHVDDDEEEEEDDEAFQNFLLEDAPLGLQCPIGICLLTDPVTAADGHTYQRAELEKWIETCRVKQQPLTSHMPKENMARCILLATSSRRRLATFLSSAGRRGWRQKERRREGSEENECQTGMKRGEERARLATENVGGGLKATTRVQKNEIIRYMLVPSHDNIINV